MSIWSKVKSAFTRDMPTVRYDIQAFTLYKASPKTIAEKWCAVPEDQRKRGIAGGFYRYDTREMWVPYGYGDKFDATILEHEMRHLPEIEGRWHD